MPLVSGSSSAYARSHPDSASRLRRRKRRAGCRANRFEELLDAGIARVLVPRRFGGDELGLDVWFEVAREIGKADASHAWCASLMIHHPHCLAQCSEEAQAAVWADGPDVSVAASLMPLAKVVPVDGGYRISGEGPFASGVGHSPWSFVGGMVETDGGPDWTLFLLPAKDYAIKDTWFTAGMKATGSNTIVTDNVFVPTSRTIRMADLRDGTGPGGRLHANPIYRAPIAAYGPLCFTAAMLGAAQGAYEAVREGTRTKKGPGGVAVAESESIQMRLARSAANLDAVDLLLRRAVDTVRGPLPLEIRARSMRDFTRAVELTIEAVDTLMSMSGTAGFAASHPLQRAWRDIHFAAMHLSLSADRNYVHFGRMELGLPRDPRLPFY